MLAAAVCGDIFASPSAKQVTTAIKAVGSKEGTILIITNYTGSFSFLLLCPSGSLTRVQATCYISVWAPKLSTRKDERRLAAAWLETTVRFRGPKEGSSVDEVLLAHLLVSSINSASITSLSENQQLPKFWEQRLSQE